MVGNDDDDDDEKFSVPTSSMFQMFSPWLSSPPDVHNIEDDDFDGTFR